MARGSNENTGRLLRQCSRRGSALHAHNPETLAMVATQLHAPARKWLEPGHNGTCAYTLPLTIPSGRHGAGHRL
jgi:hypothetical protein